MGVSQYRLALAIGVPESQINAIVKGRRTIPSGMRWLLSSPCSTSPFDSR